MRIALVALAAGLALAGCVERKMFIRSDPPGARIRLNREAASWGTTPGEIDFDYYGTYDVVLEREGYRPLHTTAAVPAPWYAWPGVDLLTEVLLPFTIEDHREFEFSLEPLAPEPDIADPAAVEAAAEEALRRTEGVRARGEEIRKEVDEGDPAEIR